MKTSQDSMGDTPRTSQDLTGDARMIVTVVRRLLSTVSEDPKSRVTCAKSTNNDDQEMCLFGRLIAPTTLFR